MGEVMDVDMGSFKGEVCGTSRAQDGFWPDLEVVGSEAFQQRKHAQALSRRACPSELKEASSGLKLG